MQWIGELWRQVRYRLSGARFDDDLAEEMRLHVDLRALPTTDSNDNETVLCYRSYFPAPNAAL